jgi:hypothetical protein
MNEQRTQADLNLINQLLTCNEGDESRILQENQELLNEGLVQVMVAVAEWLCYIGAKDIESYID